MSNVNNKTEWIDKCLSWKIKWPIHPPPINKNNHTDTIDLYRFMSVLNNNLNDDSIIVSDAGSAYYVVSQSIIINNNRRYITDGSQAAMGAYQMSVGVALASKKEVICITGDGSFNFCPEILAVIKEHKLNIKLFIWNNYCYLSIQNSQKKFYNNRIFGTDSTSGLWFPEINKIADAYGIDYLKVESESKLDDIIKQSLSLEHSVIIEVICDKNQRITPELAMKNNKSTPLSDMYPFLSEEEYNSEMIKD